MLQEQPKSEVADLTARPTKDLPPAKAKSALHAWISVALMLPPEYEEVLLWWDESFPASVGCWTGRTWQDANGPMNEYDADPAYWTPIPSTPTECSA